MAGLTKRCPSCSRARDLVAELEGLSDVLSDGAAGLCGPAPGVWCEECDDAGVVPTEEGEAFLAVVLARLKVRLVSSAHKTRP